ncbi:uncharacterized protein TRIADDRAFT_60216 [Trichoplax adhaerens]|uniref:Bromo domain-containing protein n=1 Tax=Trichoplax adhaerens TaxID=10228 RepID=B3S7M2_TRIAD|nr:hypothetical protein TRIADDRAFT_60216 [Trichoplax adhaerens]EDV21222.1 hypothetical protein TRIADDRAFT_60216 [Trichoplax adhaerens]|eukprot:XP_002116189.1 hypothetical protein TRIADDRAFT_60216 [Trichoplax adhaerens]
MTERSRLNVTEIDMSMVDDRNDVSCDEARRVLRRLELEAYSSITSALRAQGDLCKEKKQLLQDICYQLGISTERYRAELRRAANDDMLTTIANRLSGSNSSEEWLSEGRRLAPVVPRLVPQTVLSPIANAAATTSFMIASGRPPTIETISLTKSDKQDLNINGAHNSIELPSFADKQSKITPNGTTDEKNDSTSNPAVRVKRKRRMPMSDSNNRDRSKLSKSASLHALTSKLSKQTAVVSPSSEIIAQIMNPVTSEAVTATINKKSNRSNSITSASQSISPIETNRKNLMPSSKKQRSNLTSAASSIENRHSSTTTVTTTTTTASSASPSSSLQVNKSTSKQVNKHRKYPSNIKTSKSFFTNSSASLTTASASIKTTVSSISGSTSTKIKVKLPRQRSKATKSKISLVVPAMIKPDKVKSATTVASGATTSSTSVSVVNRTGILTSTSSIPTTAVSESKGISNITSLLRTTAKQNRLATTTISTSSPFCSNPTPTEQHSTNSVVATMGSQNITHSALNSTPRFTVPIDIRNLQDQSRKLTESLNKTILSTSLQRNSSKATSKLLSEISKSKTTGLSENTTRGILDRQQKRSETTNQGNITQPFGKSDNKNTKKQDGQNTIASLAMQSAEHDESQDQSPTKPSLTNLTSKLGLEFSKSVNAHIGGFDDAKKNNNTSNIKTDNKELEIDTCHLRKESAIDSSTPVVNVTKSTDENVENRGIISVKTVDSSNDDMMEEKAFSQVESNAIDETIGESKDHINERTANLQEDIMVATDDHDYCIDSSTLSHKVSEKVTCSDISLQSSSNANEAESPKMQTETDRMDFFEMSTNGSETSESNNQIDKGTTVVTSDDLKEDRSYNLTSHIDDGEAVMDNGTADMVSVISTDDRSNHKCELSNVSGDGNSISMTEAIAGATAAKATDESTNVRQIDVTNDFEIVVEKIEVGSGKIHHVAHAESNIKMESMEKATTYTDLFDTISEDSMPDNNSEVPMSIDVTDTEVDATDSCNYNESEATTKLTGNSQSQREVADVTVRPDYVERDSVNVIVGAKFDMENPNKAKVGVKVKDDDTDIILESNTEVGNTSWTEIKNNYNEVRDSSHLTPNDSEADPAVIQGTEAELAAQVDDSEGGEVVTENLTNVSSESQAEINSVGILEIDADFNKGTSSEVYTDIDIHLEGNLLKESVRNTDVIPMATIDAKEDKVLDNTTNLEIESGGKENLMTKVSANLVEAKLEDDNADNAKFKDETTGIKPDDSKYLDKKTVQIEDSNVTECSIMSSTLRGDNDNVKQADIATEKIDSVSFETRNSGSSPKIVSVSSYSNFDELPLRSVSTEITAVDSFKNTKFRAKLNIQEDAMRTVNNANYNVPQVEKSKIESNLGNFTDVARVVKPESRNELAQRTYVVENSISEESLKKDTVSDANSTSVSDVISFMDFGISNRRTEITNIGSNTKIFNSKEENMDSNASLTNSITINSSCTALNYDETRLTADKSETANLIAGSEIGNNVTGKILNLGTEVASLVDNNQTTSEVNSGKEAKNTNVKVCESNKSTSENQSTNILNVVSLDSFANVTDFDHENIRSTSPNTVDIDANDVSNDLLRKSETIVHTFSNSEIEMENNNESSDVSIYANELPLDNKLETVDEVPTESTDSEDILTSDDQSAISDSMYNIAVNSNHQSIDNGSSQFNNNQIYGNFRNTLFSENELIRVEETKNLKDFPDNIMIRDISTVANKVLPIDILEDDKRSNVDNCSPGTSNNDNGNDLDSSDKADVVKDSSNGHMDINSNEIAVNKSNHVDDFKTILKRKKNSKRKRKIEISNKRSLNSLGVEQKWIKAAFKFKGSGRPKKTYTAASWFLKPVEENHAPGYYDVITNPMDFSTIRKKLESGAYGNYRDFNDDMELIKTNCHLYNPPDHAIRKDCDEVFDFYHGEYNKLLANYENVG